MALPKDIQARFAADCPGGEIKIAARALADIEGNLGEAFLVCDGATAFIYSRRLGEDVQTIQVPLATVTHAMVEEDRPFVHLMLATAEHNLRLKFGGLDQEDLEAFAQLCREPADQAGSQAAPAGDAPSAVAMPVESEPPAAPSAQGDLDPFVGFAAALYSMIECDGKVDEEERHELNRLVGESEYVTRGIDYLHRHGRDQLLAELDRVLSTKQKHCLLANLLELSMVDGYLRPEEQDLISQYLAAFDIDEEDYGTVYQVLTIKNNLSIFTI